MRGKRLGGAIHEQVQVHWPRLQIMIILGLTGVAAFLTSMLLLRLGVTQMVVRYPIAIATAYGTFVLLIGVWLWLQSRGADMLDVASEVLDHVNYRSDGQITSTSGSADLAGMNSTSVSSSGGGGSGIDLPDIDLDLDVGDLFWVVLALVVLIAGLIAIFYVVYIAPVLLAEVLVDGLLAAGLYKSVKGATGRHWMMTVLRKTAIPAVLVLIFFSIAGFCVQMIEPAATSIGEAWRLLWG